MKNADRHEPGQHAPDRGEMVSRMSGALVVKLSRRCSWDCGRPRPTALPGLGTEMSSRHAANVL